MSGVAYSIRRQVTDRVARVADEQAASEGRRMLSVRRTAMLDSAQLYTDLASTIGSSLTDLVRKRRQLDQDTRERAHITAALETTTTMTTSKNRRQQHVGLRSAVVRPTAIRLLSVRPSGLPWVWGFTWRFPWVWVWYGYGDCDESPWVLWVICGDF